MLIELNDASAMDALRGYLQRHGCPSEPAGPELVEVRVLWSPDAPLTDDEARAKVFGHVRDWCSAHPGVHANLVG
jgi:hypothetical protein